MTEPVVTLCVWMSDLLMQLSVCLCESVLLLVVDVRDALVGVGLILNDNENFTVDKGSSLLYVF